MMSEVEEKDDSELEIDLLKNENISSTNKEKR